jgi:hypothetical protein
MAVITAMLLQRTILFLLIVNRASASFRHQISDDEYTCPVDKEDTDEREAVKRVSFSFQSPPTTLIEDRAESIANSFLKNVQHPAKSCCVPFPIHLWSAIESGLVEEPPRLGEVVTAQSLVEAEKKKVITTTTTITYRLVQMI